MHGNSCHSWLPERKFRRKLLWTNVYVQADQKCESYPVRDKKQNINPLIYSGSCLSSVSKNVTVKNILRFGSVDLKQVYNNRNDSWSHHYGVHARLYFLQ